MNRTRFVLCLLALLAALVGMSALLAHDDHDGETVRIIANLRESGAVEFGLRTSDGDQWPVRRVFPASVNDGRWKRSSPIELSNGTSVRIIARRNFGERLEFGLRIDEPLQEFLPTRRRFPLNAEVGALLSSSPVLLPAPAHPEEATQPTEPTEPEEPAVETTPQTDPSTETSTSDPAPDAEVISGTHRDGLIVAGGIVGDPDAPVLIVEYGDPF